jgi:hypothetical protein
MGGATLALLFITLAGVSGCQSDDDGIRLPPPPSTDDSYSPSPEELLTQVSEFFSTHSEIAFEALVTYEAVQESGQKLQFDLVQRVAVSQPDRLFWVTLLDDGTTNTVWYSDGLFTMLKQPENIYGQIEVPATIPEMIDVVVNDYGIVVPFGDLLASGDDPVFLQDLESSFYAGLAWVEDTWAHHLALRNELVDFQMWLREDGDPVPQKLAITWKHEEGLPGFVARFRKWQTSPSFDESRFRFVAPPDAERIEIIPINPGSEVGY